MPGGGGPGETGQTQIRHGNTDPFKAVVTDLLHSVINLLYNSK